MRSTSLCQMRTGHSELFDLCIAISASLSPFFWRRNVIITESIFLFFILPEFGTSFHLPKKRISLRVSKVVFRFPFTVEYSQERIPKNKAPAVSWPIAVVASVVLLL